MSVLPQIKRAATGLAVAGEERKGKTLLGRVGGYSRAVMGVLRVTFVIYSLAVTFLFGILIIIIIIYII